MAEVGRAVYDLLGPRTRGVDIVILDYVIDVLKVRHRGARLASVFVLHSSFSWPVVTVFEGSLRVAT